MVNQNNPETKLNPIDRDTFAKLVTAGEWTVINDSQHGHAVRFDLD